MGFSIGLQNVHVLIKYLLIINLLSFAYWLKKSKHLLRAAFTVFPFWKQCNVTYVLNLPCAGSTCSTLQKQYASNTVYFSQQNYISFVNDTNDQSITVMIALMLSLINQNPTTVYCNELYSVSLRQVQSNTMHFYLEVSHYFKWDLF